MTSALIGYTGFVGGNLDRPHRFAARFNSENFRDMAGRRFGLVVCAGLSATKWLANKEPDADWARITALMDTLRRVKAERFVLVSTVDVYPEPVAVDEATPIDRAAGHAYGRHRLQCEDFVRDQFADAHVLRLPGLFGPGLKKNAIFDLINRNALDAINPDSRFQWYDVTRLWRDIEGALMNRLPLVNLVNEPIRTGDIIERFFPDLRVGAASPVVTYDVHSRYAEGLGGVDGYMERSATVLDQIGRFVRRASPRKSDRGAA